MIQKGERGEKEKEKKNSEGAFPQVAVFMHVFILDNKMSTCSLNEGPRRWGREVEKQGNGFLNQLAAGPKIGGLVSATITALIEVGVVNLVVN